MTFEEQLEKTKEIQKVSLAVMSKEGVGPGALIAADLIGFMSSQGAMLEAVGKDKFPKIDRKEFGLRFRVEVVDE